MRYCTILSLPPGPYGLWRVGVSTSVPLPTEVRSSARPVAVASQGLNPQPLWIRYSPDTATIVRPATDGNTILGKKVNQLYVRDENWRFAENVPTGSIVQSWAATDTLVQRGRLAFGNDSPAIGLTQILVDRGCSDHQGAIEAILFGPTVHL